MNDPTYRPFVVMTAEVPGPGKLRRVSIVETTDGRAPSRIDLRIRNVRGLWLDRNHGPDTFDAAVSEADQLCERLNEEMGTLRSKYQEFTCPRCEGSGRIPNCDHVAEGVCFGCDGARRITRGRQWRMIYSARHEASDLDRQKIDYIFNATPECWIQMSEAKLIAASVWVENGPFAGLVVLPPVALQRLSTLQSVQPKPF